jgi:hypothetical protein
MASKTPTKTTRRRRTEGFGLLDVVLTFNLLTIVGLGLVPLGLVAMGNYGHVLERGYDYAQDEMKPVRPAALPQTR